MENKRGVRLLNYFMSTYLRAYKLFPNCDQYSISVELSKEQATAFRVLSEPYTDLHTHRGGEAMQIKSEIINLLDPAMIKEIEAKKEIGVTIVEDNCTLGSQIEVVGIGDTKEGRWFTIIYKEEFREKEFL